MADNTTSQQELPSALVYNAFKKASPDLSDQQIVTAYNAVKDELASKQVNINTIPDKDLANIAFNVTSKLKQQASQPPQDAKVAPVQVAPPTNIGTDLKNPFAGTAMAERSPENPQAALMNTFDPEQIKQAYQKNNDIYNANIPGRQVSNMFAAQVSPEMLKTTQGQWDKQAPLTSPLDLQKALQEGATQGIKGATDIQSQFKTAGEYTSAQAIKQQELTKGYLENVTSALSTEQQQRLDQPNSPETLLAKQLLTAQLAQLPENSADAKALATILNDPKVTARQLLPAMAQWAPGAMKAWGDKVTGGKTIAETGLTGAQTGLTQAQTGKTGAETAKIGTETTNIQQQGKNFAEQQGIAAPVYPSVPGVEQPQPTTPAPAPTGDTSVNAPNPNPTFNFKPGTDLGAVRAVLARGQDANVLAAFDKQFPEIAAGSASPQVNPAPQGVGGGRGTVNPPMASEPQPAPTNYAQQAKPDFGTLTGALSQPDNLDPTYVSTAKTSDLSQVQSLVRQRLDAAAAGDSTKIVALDKQIAAATGTPYVKEPVQTISVPNGSGGFSTEMNPSQSGLMAKTAQNIAAKSDSIDTFQMSGKPAAQNSYQLASSAGYDKAGNMVPLSSEQSSKLQLAVDRLNAEATRLGQVVSGSSSAGTAAAAGALGALHPLLGSAAGVFANLTNQSQALTNKSQPEVIKQYAVATQLAAQRQSLLLQFEKAYSASHNGNTSGFTTSPDYKMVMNAQPYVDGKTGDVKIPLTRSQQDDALRSGYGPLSSMSFTTPQLATALKGQ